jgi:hypothetical protein
VLSSRGVSMRWKQKAIELLVELDFVRQGHITAAEYFECKDFIDAFKGLVVQYLQDSGYSAPEHELRTCLLLRRIAFETMHGVELTFTGQGSQAKWIAETVALWTGCLELIKNDLIRTIIQMAQHLEDTSKKQTTVSFESQPSFEELIGLSSENQPTIEELIERFESR